MQYTTLGTKTGLKVSVLGFGAMRLPMVEGRVDRDKAVPMIHRAFELGVNYIDSAVMYCSGDSQAAVGEALKGWRDKIVVSTKNHQYAKDDYATWRKNFEESLAKLDCGHIDVYNFHGLSWKRFTEDVGTPGGAYEWMQKAKDEGLIKHICFSTHDSPEGVAELAKTGQFDVVTLQYNLLDRRNEPAIQACHEAGMGVVVMGPVGGGRLGAPSDQLRQLVPGADSVPEVALRFVLSNPHVSVALSGMSTIEHVEENCTITAGKATLTPDERQQVEQTLEQYKKLAELYCTGCKYCMPCPAGVNIPENFDNFNKLRVYGLEDQARGGYRRSGNPASLCIACGQCMSKCPQNIDIIRQLRETVHNLDDAYGTLAVRLRPTGIESGGDGQAGPLRLRGRVELANLSDQTLEAQVAFEPADGVKVEAKGEPTTLEAFQHRNVPVTIEARYEPGQALETGLKVAGPLPATLGPSALTLALAAPGGRDALPTAGRQPIAVNDANHPDAAAPAGDFALAWDAENLWLRLNLPGQPAFPPAPKRAVQKADRVELDFDTTGLARGEGDRAPALQLRFQVGLPDAETGQCPVRVARPQWGRSADGIVATAEPAGAGTVLTVQIPWQRLDCPAGTSGASFQLGLAQLAHDEQGHTKLHRHWAPDTGWVVLA